MTRALSRRLALSLPALMAKPVLAVGGPPHRGEGPDAELIRLCGVYMIACDTYNASECALEPEVDPLWHALLRLEDQLEGLAATTFEGLVAKARVAQHQAQQLDGSENYSDSFTGDWLEQIARDLLAMAERAQA